MSKKKEHLETGGGGLEEQKVPKEKPSFPDSIPARNTALKEKSLNDKAHKMGMVYHERGSWKLAGNKKGLAYYAEDVEEAFRLAMRDLKEEEKKADKLLGGKLRPVTRNYVVGVKHGLEKAQDVLRKRFGMKEEEEKK